MVNMSFAVFSFASRGEEEGVRVNEKKAPYTTKDAKRGG
jgi:hypothetical protein